MLIQERSVTKEYWEYIEQYIARRIGTKRYAPVGKTGVVNVYGGNCTTTYAILNNNKPIAWLYLARRPSWKAWEVRQAWVFPEHRGKGLAAKIYSAAINHHNIILASGKTQSVGSRSLWLSFIRKNKFKLWAQDFNDLNLKSQVWVEDNKLQCDLQVYTHFHSKHDVRLLAMRK